MRKSDVTIAKNYLTQTEHSELDRIVVMYLDFAVAQALAADRYETFDARRRRHELDTAEAADQLALDDLRRRLLPPESASPS